VSSHEANEVQVWERAFQSSPESRRIAMLAMQPKVRGETQMQTLGNPIFGGYPFFRKLEGSQFFKAKANRERSERSNQCAN
jgi:hypothetical protein